ncbi:uncharacterized protein LOC143891187 [Tasmannia lanceolata]|uniref:uncharacterized protein LOC143891187 n=1 Tax=Tasmannia lanceolata TaxID=3420 RepID=UPI004064AD9C
MEVHRNDRKCSNKYKSGHQYSVELLLGKSLSWILMEGYSSEEVSYDQRAVVPSVTDLRFRSEDRAALALSHNKQKYIISLFCSLLHLHHLSGLALLQRHTQSKNSYEGLMEAPEAQIREAAKFHQFAEAAYTGPVLDFGRHPVLFPCVWLYRRGILTSWTRKRWPVLEGDNWWRGHAAAFLKYVNLHPDALQRGRVSQTKREVVYFIVVLHHLRSVVIAVRGTETPEDLLTDLLYRECSLSEEDLDGLINSDPLAPEVKRNVLSSFPHYGHSGIVESARELFMQVDGQLGDKGQTTGFLSSLLGAGCECQGYNIRIVGHSLGGAVATLLGLRLYRRYPNLHVYTYGTLPCVESTIAEACSSFVTSIVYNDEFSSRLSVSSIIRLRAAAVTALSQDSSANSDMISKLARRILHIFVTEIIIAVFTAEVSKPGQLPSNEETSFIDNTDTEILKDSLDEFNQSNMTSSSSDILEDSLDNPNHYDTRDICIEDSEVISCGDTVSQLNGVSLSIEVSNEDPPELFLPGFIIHIIPEQKRNLQPLWKSWKILDREYSYRAYIADRKSFKDIVVSPYMFLDHLPWRCHYAMQRIMEDQKAQGQSHADLFNQSHMDVSRGYEQSPDSWLLPVRFVIACRRLSSPARGSYLLDRGQGKVMASQGDDVIVDLEGESDDEDVEIVEDGVILDLNTSPVRVDSLDAAESSGDEEDDDDDQGTSSSFWGKQGG